MSVNRSADHCWQTILPRFGIGLEYLANRHGPCPGCGGKDRFRFDDKDGRGTWICGGGGHLSSGDGYDLISHVTGWDNGKSYREVQRWLGSHSPPPPPTKTANAPKKSDPQDYALQLWHEATEGVRFHPYAKTKGITWEGGAKRHKHASGRVIGRNADCIIVPIRDLATENVVAVQAINPEGKKQTFGPLRGNGFFCGNTLDRSLKWYVVEGWADAVSMVFHHNDGKAVAFAAFGLKMMDVLSSRVAERYAPQRLWVLEDAA